MDRQPSPLTVYMYLFLKGHGVKITTKDILLGVHPCRKRSPKNTSVEHAHQHSSGIEMCMINNTVWNGDCRVWNGDCRVWNRD